MILSPYWKIFGKYKDNKGKNTDLRFENLEICISFLLIQENKPLENFLKILKTYENSPNHGNLCNKNNKWNFRVCFFNVLGQVEDLRKDIKERDERFKADLENVRKDLKEGNERNKTNFSDIKACLTVVNESVKEGVEIKKEDWKNIEKVVKEAAKEGVKEAMNERKNTEESKMKEDYAKIPMGNIEKNDFPNPRVPDHGELYLVGFIVFIRNVN